MNKIVKGALIAFGILIAGFIVGFIIGFFEINVGRCLKDAGDGKLYNGEPFYNYISYHNIAQENDIVVTFCINDHYGDCLERFDFVVLENTKGKEG